MCKKIIDPGINDFITKHPHLEKYWDFNKNTIDPRTLREHSDNKEIWWKCPHCKREWRSCTSANIKL